MSTVGRGGAPAIWKIDDTYGMDKVSILFSGKEDYNL